ncbi:putative type VI secretion system effector [Chitinimonas taiwanensis]|uniref:Uncharacterized protein n=1 Tax=Chitinimonas taiwanensis DSM 18899 TaxID=1121279 RepID=A0A1K2HF43_9NEIS|nr:putative type VI secretion system effector [Chitinimonas taiwanensis]SFZ74938.1 hypothetical protein SAMN02745887_01395 [Chitinimonas taiwanensis DSM 18899]
MKSAKFEIIRGVVGDLQVAQEDKDFVFTAADKAAGGGAAVGLALGGLAGAATGAVLSTGDTAERVDFFVCRLGDTFVRGQFGEVNFSDGDVIEALGVRSGKHFDVLAVTRPSDRTIWMHPHCGRGTRAYLRFCFFWIGFLAWVISPAALFVLMWFAWGASSTVPPAWFIFTVYFGVGLIASSVLGFVASRFISFAHLSNDILRALCFEKPEEVDLPKRLREVSKTFTNEERLKYHPHARWVYKY